MKSTIRFIHCSDTHLGKVHHSMRTESETNRNLMSIDVENQFNQIIDTAIEEQVDFIIHSGDMFDRVNIRHIDIEGALKPLTKLQSQNIPFVAIAGNHDRPYTKGVVSPINLVSYIPKCYTIPNFGVKKLTVNGADVSLHATSYIRTNVDEEYKKIIKQHLQQDSKDYNIFIGHQIVQGGQAGFEISATNEPIVNPGIFPDHWNYIAMGHLHKQQTIKHPRNSEQRINFPGSPVIIDFGERKEKKSVSLVSITGNEIEIEFIRLPTRKFEEVVISVQNPTSQEIEEKIKDELEKRVDSEKYLGIRLKGGIQIALRKYTNPQYYRKLALKYAGFDIYFTPEFNWFDLSGKVIQVEQDWLLKPYDELEAAINSQEGLSNENKLSLLTIGKQVIDEYREGK